MKILVRLLLAWVPIVVLLLLVTTNVRVATSSIALYNLLFDRYNVSEGTGILADDLPDVGRQFRDYFGNDEELLQVNAHVFGVEQPLLSNKEVIHMADVKQVIKLTFRLQEGAGIFLLAMMLGAVAVYRQRSVWEISGWVQWGALITILFVLVVGFISLVAFGPLFTAFHRLAFTNDFWLLDPRTDYLIKLFPFGFWRDITLLIGLATLLEGVALFLVGRRLTWQNHKDSQASFVPN
jgi:integral membrane protein (TIGR01906 family)